MNKSQSLKRIEELREIIHHHDRLYYTEANPEISDRQYDEFFSELKKLEDEYPEFVSEDSPTQRVSETPIEGFEHVTHRVPMLSIDNTYSPEDLRDFDKRIKNILDNEDYRFVIEPKIDGVAVSILYENGIFKQAATRGNGQVGDDITHNVRTLRSVPLTLSGNNHPEIMEVRGEIVWPVEAFNKYNEKLIQAGKTPFANPRNATSGTLKQLDPAKVKDRGLVFVSHGVGYIEPENYEEYALLKTDFHSWGIPVSEKKPAIYTVDQIIDLLDELNKNRQNLPYETDGIVIKINSLAHRKELGETSRHPRWCIAYKFESEQAETVLEGVDYQVGKFGTITPRARLSPVLISGTTVQHASLHNFDQVERLGVKIGDTVIIEKAGEIIPQVVSVVLEKRPKKTKNIVPPESCPICDGKIMQDEGGVSYRCVNPLCSAQRKEKLIHFASRNQMNIEGAGRSLIENLVDTKIEGSEKHLLEDFADMYELKNHRDQLINMERQGEKSIDNLLLSIESSKNNSLASLLSSINIRFLGNANARILVDHFVSVRNDDDKRAIIDLIMDADENDLTEIHGIGPELATMVSDFFKSSDGQNIIKRLRNAGLNMDESAKKQTTDSDSPIQGKRIVVTGKLSTMTRNEMHDLIRDRGADPGDSISKNVDILVCGEKAGSKLSKAQKLDITIMSEEEFMNYLSE